MRRAVLLSAAASLLACADYRQKPTFPEGAAHQPVVNEQAILGFDAQGDALVAHLIDADGQPPQLQLLVFDRGGAPTRTLLSAPEAAARAVAARVLRDGRRPLPLLEAAVKAGWPDGKAAGFLPLPQALPEPGSRRFPAGGVAENGSLPLILREDDADGSLVLFLAEKPGGPDVELTRMPLSGDPVAPQLFVNGGVAWLLSGSSRRGEPLHRAVGIRRASLRRGEAELHNLHGLTDYAAGDLDAARREFGRAIAADGAFVDPLYNAATTAALADDDAAALAFLKRAAAADPARVQVLGRGDEDLRRLRKRKDVRDLLGQRRPAPENVPSPP